MELLWMLAAVVLVLYLSYKCSRFIAVRGGGFAGASGNMMRLLSRLPLGQDKQLVLVEVGGRYLLIGVSAAGIQMLAELTEEQASKYATESQDVPKDFRAILRDGLSSISKKDKDD